MATTTKHSALTGADMHTIVRWVVADVAGLPTDVAAEDVHKVAYVTANKTYYGLVAHSPAEWRAFGHADNPVVSVTEAGGELTITRRDGTWSTITLPAGGGGGSTSEMVPAATPLMLWDEGAPPGAAMDAIILRDGKQYLPLFTWVPSSAYVEVALYSETEPAPVTVRLVGVRIKYEVAWDSPYPLDENPILAEIAQPNNLTSAIPLDPAKVAVTEPLQPAIEGLALPPQSYRSAVPVFNEAEGVWEWAGVGEEIYVDFLVTRDVPYALITWIEVDLEFPDYTGADITADYDLYAYAVFTGYGPDPYGNGPELERREHLEDSGVQITSTGPKAVTAQIAWGPGGV